MSNIDKSKAIGLPIRQTSISDPLAQVVVCKRLAKMPMRFLAVRNNKFK